MARIRLIVNPASGSHDADMPARLAEVAAQAGAEFAGVTALPDDPMPTPASLDAERVDILAVHAGDGTINTAMQAVAGWGGAILALPGGTMNLLARHIHESRDPVEIFTAALAPDVDARPVTMVEGVDADCAISGLVGVFAGPTTAWGDVRETLRRYDFAGLVEAVPRAIGQTFDGAPVRLSGHDEDYPAIYIEPVDGTLRLLGFLADDAAALFEHGFAWLGGDFRDGPHEELGTLGEVTIESGTRIGGEIGLLVDGERGHSHSPLRLRAVPSPVAFIMTRSHADTLDAA
jgi:hypothetical protein